MKPRELLSAYPADEAIIHECGHVAVGLALKLHEGGIEFLKIPKFEIARAHYNSIGISPLDQIIRSLAGMYAQALCIPGSIDSDLQRQIVDGSLFAKNAEKISNSAIPELIEKFGFAGDWIKIINAVAKLTARDQEIVGVLSRAFLELEKFFEDGRLKATVLKIAVDVKCWLENDDLDAPLWECVIYPIARARQIFNGC